MGKSPHFGPRVQGKKNYDKEAEAQERGESHFGTRVTGARAGSEGAQARARANSEFGPLVTVDAEREELSVEELEEVLAENPTFFDQLYENEMSRPGGPRSDALEVLDLVEMGPKGAGRQEIHAEIQAKLGNGDPHGIKRGFAERDAHIERAEAREERAEENKLLVDAPRLRALRERDSDLALVRKGKGSQAAAVSEDSTSAVSRRADELLGETPPKKKAAARKRPRSRSKKK